MNSHPDKSSVHPGVALVAVVLFVSGALLVPGASPPEPPNTTSYIVQAADSAVAGDAVVAAGGVVTHRLPVIAAVGARLTAGQHRTLAASPALRLTSNHPARVASCSGLSAELVKLDGDKLEWEITNSSPLPVTIDAMALAWPRENAGIEKVKFDGSDIYETPMPGPRAFLQSGWDGKLKDRTLEAGKDATLELQFEKKALLYEPAYSLVVGFAGGCTLEFTPRTDTCAVAGWGGRELKDKKLQWEIYNAGAVPATVSGISLNWPDGNGELVKLKLDGATLFEGARPGPVAAFHDDWTDGVDHRRIKAGDDATVELEFMADIDLDQEKYTVNVEFHQGCEVSFTAGSGSSDYDKKARRTPYTTQVGADLLHDEGIFGTGVTVAVIDSGLSAKGGGEKWLRRNRHTEPRLRAGYDATTGLPLDSEDLEDENGHGSHVTSILASSRKTSRSGGSGVSYNGVAPGAGLVAVKAFDELGNGTYLDIIRGIQFVIDHKDLYGIRVLNLSFSGEPRSFYWDDPLAQAVMAAWKAGIVVVASAGNTGPEPMTVGVPGNVPYIVTVGAMTDGYTPYEPADDRLTVFSAAGPTFEGFVKPDVIAPGGHMLGLMDKDSRIPKEHKEFHDSEDYFVMSGTSQATAVVSGLAALLLEAEPSLTPDEVKCRLMASARLAIDDLGAPVYSVFQQGAGLVNGAAALLSSAAGCANRGLDLEADLDGSQRFAGRAAVTEDGTFYLRDVEGSGFVWADGFIWADAFAGQDGFVWADAFAGNDGFVWADAFAAQDGFVWADAFAGNDGFVWADATMWNDGFVWADLMAMSINTWVEQE